MTNLVETGIHVLTLRVFDGANSGTFTFNLEVITHAAAATNLAAQVESAHLARKAEHALLDCVGGTEAAFDQNHFADGIRQLRNFQEEVLESNLTPAIVQELVAAAQEIIQAVSQPLIASRVQELILSVELAALPTGMRQQLIEALVEAAKDFSRDDLRNGVDKLQKFQNKAERQLSAVNGQLGEQLIQAAQRLIDEAAASTNVAPPR